MWQGCARVSHLYEDLWLSMRATQSTSCYEKSADKILSLNILTVILYIKLDTENGVCHR